MTADLAPRRPGMKRIWQKLRLRLNLAGAVFSGLDDDLDRCMAKASFAQCGEDVIAWFLLKQLGVERPTYADVGAHHPQRLSNTALFYALGGRGVNIEPDPDLFAAFLRERPRDVNLNVGVSEKAGEAEFFQMTDPSLNTFSAEEAERMQAERGILIRARQTLPVAPLSVLLTRAGVSPEFVSIDVEGRDLAVLKTLDLTIHRPGVLCVETVDFVSGRKNPEVAAWLAPHDYAPYADTRINTLFVDTRRFPLP
jgi:FkbM family methyltransferase